MKIRPLTGRRIRIVNQPLQLCFTTVRMQMRNVSGVIGVFTRSVLSIPSGKIPDKNLCIDGKRFANLLAFEWEVALTCYDFAKPPETSKSVF